MQWPFLAFLLTHDVMLAWLMPSPTNGLLKNLAMHMLHASNKCCVMFNKTQNNVCFFVVRQTHVYRLLRVRLAIIGIH